MTTGTRYTVLGHGEAYIGTDYSPPRRAVVGTEEPPAFERAQALLRPQFEAVASSVRALKPGQRLDEVVVELRLNERFLAKSYRPDDLLKNTGLTARGMGTWEQTLDAARAAKKRPKRAKDAPEEVGPVSVPSLSIYASGTDKSLQRLRDAIEGSVGGPAVRGDLAHLEAIRLPTVQDRAIELETVDSDPMPIEIVLYDWDQRHRDAAVSRLRAIALRSGVVEEDFLVRSYTDGPTFVATVVPHDAVDEIRDLNFLRLARPLPRIALTRTALTMKMTAPPAPGKATPVAWIAAFDGGCKADLPHFDGSVVARDLTSKPEIPGYVSHGTAVASAAVYGSIAPGGTLSPPACGVLALRVLPDARNSLELYGAIDAIEYEVPRLAPEIQVVNLSFGPAGPITPSKPPSRFTYAIDRLTFETKKLFFTAVGNWGDKVGFDGIQSPSDSVSNVSVGAYEVNPANGHRRPAAYTCKGPGRSGGVRKPDLLAFGGSHAAPFIVLDPSPGEMEGTMGTSFACPTAASLAAQVLARVDAPISEQACRALLIHATEPLDGESPHATGWGVLPPTPEQVLACSSKRVSVLYSGVLSPRMAWRLPFLLPENFDPGGNVSLEWTICYAPEVKYDSTSEYTLAGIELQLRPHAHRYSFSRKDPQDPKNPKKTSYARHDIEADKAIVKRLLADGWKRAPEPLTDGDTALDERSRRDAGKWETVVRGSCNKRKDSILRPSLTVSIVGRGPWDVANPKLQAVYAAVLTASAPKYKGDLYAEVRNKFDKLRPLALRGRAQASARLRGFKP